MTPSERLAKILTERELGKSEFARQVEETTGSRCRYYNVHRWTKGREFTARNRKRAARTLGLADDYFDRPDVAQAREQETQRVFARWLERAPAAKLLTPSQLDVLRSMRFLADKPRPSSAVYNAVAAAFLGMISDDEIDDVAEENDKLARILKDKTPPKRR